MVKKICVTLCILAVMLCGCREEIAKADTQEHQNNGVADMHTIVALGDSLTAGYGVDLSESYPAVLEKMLRKNGYKYKVINAGVSGETSSGTLSRVEWIMTQNPDIVIVETGANDGFRGVPVTLVKKNLIEIVTILQKKNVRVLLAGMKMVWNLGPDYVLQFNEIYPQLAEEKDIELMPFFLEDVAIRDNLNLEDGIHPNSEGYEIIVDNLYPHVVKVIQSVNK